MPLWKIAWRSIQRRSLASALTTLSMALGVMLVVSVLLVVGVVDSSFERNSSLGYNTIIGAKGGKLQLVLNTVFYLSQPVENLPFEFYQEFLPAAQRGSRNAEAGHDYARSIEYHTGAEWKPVDGPLTIQAGQERLEVRAPIIKDDNKEPAEEFSLTAVLAQQQDAQHHVINTRATGVCTIASELPTPPPVEDWDVGNNSATNQETLARLAIGDISVAEADDTHAVFTISLTQPCAADVMFDIALADGRDGIFAAYVDNVVPVCLGDYYQNYRVVGTTPELFDFVYDVSLQLKYEFAEGRNFQGKRHRTWLFPSGIGCYGCSRNRFESR